MEQKTERVKIDWEQVRLLAIDLDRLADQVRDDTVELARQGEIYPGSMLLRGAAIERINRAHGALVSAAVGVAVHLDDRDADAVTDRDWIDPRFKQEGVDDEPGE